MDASRVRSALTLPSARSLGLLWVGLALQAPAPAQELPIVNPGFEQLSRPLAPGEITNGAGGTGVPVGTLADFFALPQFDDPVEVAGWRTPLPSGQGNFTVYAGVMNPPPGLPNEPFLEGYSGTYVAATRHVWMQQTLPVRYRPRTRYTLSFLCGAGRTEPGDGVYAALLASPDLATLAFVGVPGVTTVALSAYSTPPGSEGQMLPYSIEFTTPAVLPATLQGHYIAIAFVGGDGIPLMNFDDFKLTAKRLVTPGRRGSVESGGVSGRVLRSTRGQGRRKGLRSIRRWKARREARVLEK